MKSTFIRKCPASCVSLVLLATGVASADQKVAPDVPASGDLDIIVQYQNYPTSGDLKDAQSKGGVLKNQFVSAEAVSYHVPAGSVSGIGANPNVKHVSPDRPVSRLLEFANPTVNANVALQYGYDGYGIGVAVIDSGISAGKDLNATSDGKGVTRVVYWESFTGSDGSDKFGHGTHVAGIVGGNGSLSSDKGDVYTFRGIAPMVNIVNLQVLDANGNGTDSAVIQAIEQAVALKSAYNIKVASSYYEGKGGGNSSDYFRLNGTSMAAPMVSGAAALLLQQDPTLTPDQVKARLMLTSTMSFPAYSTTTDPVTHVAYTSQYDIFSVGAGYHDIWAALNNTTKIVGASISPTALQDTKGHIYLADTDSINPAGAFTVWGSTGSSSTFTAWGSSGPLSLFTVWGSSVLEAAAAPNSSLFTVWGSAGILGSFTVWGSNYPGASASDTGAFTVWGSTTPGAEATLTGSSTLTNGEN